MVKLLAQALLALVATVLPWSASNVMACSCFPLPPPYRAYKEADAVFIGKVTSSKEVPHEEIVRDKKFTVHDRHFQFSVEEALKGTKTAEIDINVGRVDSSCYQGFTVGEVYLVYAYADSSGELSSGACTRTSHIKHAFDDLHGLPALLTMI
jgi:hypothetical protein